MATFELLAGSHIGPGEQRLEPTPGGPPQWQGGYKDMVYRKKNVDEIVLVESDTDLVKRFGNEKFRLLDPREASYRTSDEGKRLQALLDDLKAKQEELRQTEERIRKLQEGMQSHPAHPHAMPSSSQEPPVAQVVENGDKPPKTKK